MKTLWLLYRFLMLAAAASLAVYIPYKYATQLHAIEGIYAVLFPLSSVLALGGILFALRPQYVFSLPLWIRSAVSAIAVGWIATGVICVPSLSRTVIAAPLKGIFAFFHMTAQHIFLALGITFLMLAPHVVYGFFKQPEPSPDKTTERATSEV